MQARHLSLALVLAGCRLDLAEFPPVCDPQVETCPPGSGSTSGASTGDDAAPQDGVQTVTSATTQTTASGSGDEGNSGTTTGEPAAPTIVDVKLTPDPIKFAGSIEVDVVAEHAEGVRLAYPSGLVELMPDGDGHFHGPLAVHSGLSNGTSEATLIPWYGEREGEPVVRPYGVELPTPGSDFLWDPMPDYGLGQFDVLRIHDGRVYGLGTIFKDNSPRCIVHRRDLEGKYGGGDVQFILGDQECWAIDLAVDGDTLHLLVSMMSGNGPRWRYGIMSWGQDPSFLRTGLQGEVAHALARSESGTTRICGAGPTADPTDLRDARVWPVVGAPLELDYVPPPEPNNPNPQSHMFDETLHDCDFVGERLVAVGEAFGQHELGDWNPKPPERMRPLLLEMEDKPVWHVAGLGPGNTTQGSILTMAIDGQGRYVTGLYTCGDTCDPQGEVRVYEPGGTLAWQVTLGANVQPPQDVAWSPAGYLVVASAETTGDLSSKFLLQAFIPGQLAPAWSFSRAEVASFHLARAVTVGQGAVVGGGLAGNGFPTLVFLRP